MSTLTLFTERGRCLLIHMGLEIIRSQQSKRFASTITLFSTDVAVEVAVVDRKVPILFSNT